MAEQQDDPWEGVEPERREIAKAIFQAARQIAEENGDGEWPTEGPPAYKAVSGGFNRLVHRAASGELDENDPQDMVDALRLVSAAMVDQRQPEQYRGFKWLTGGEEPLVPPDRFEFVPPEARGLMRPKNPEVTMEQLQERGQPFGLQQPEPGWEPSVRYTDPSQNLDVTVPADMMQYFQQERERLGPQLPGPRRRAMELPPTRYPEKF
jgi:hypothetical protein